MPRPATTRIGNQPTGVYYTFFTYPPTYRFLVTPRSPRPLSRLKGPRRRRDGPDLCVCVCVRVCQLRKIRHDDTSYNGRVTHSPCLSILLCTSGCCCSLVGRWKAALSSNIRRAPVTTGQIHLLLLLMDMLLLPVAALATCACRQPGAYWSIKEELNFSVYREEDGGGEGGQCSNPSELGR